MIVNNAIFQDIRGELVKIGKRTSLWVMLGMLFTLVVFLVSLGVMVYGMVLASSDGTLDESAFIAIIGLASALDYEIYAAVLNSLRTKMGWAFQGTM